MEDGTWVRIWRTLLSHLDTAGQLEWARAFLDGRFVPAKKGSGVGVTKVGKGTQVRVVAEGNGLPIGLYLAPANPHAGTLAQATLQTICVPQPRGRPKTRPKELVADRAYDRRALRQAWRRRGMKPTIPPFERRKRTSPKRGRPIVVGESYAQRWKVERCFAWMDNCRRLVVRYERHLHIDWAFCLSAIILWTVNRILKWVLFKSA